MIEIGVDPFLDDIEVHLHTLSIELLGAAIDRDDPVVPMHSAALAGIGKLQMVASSDLKSLSDIVHNII